MLCFFAFALIWELIVVPERQAPSDDLQALVAIFSFFPFSWKRVFARAVPRSRDTHISKTTFRLIFEHSGEAILLTDQTGTIYRANPTSCRLFGRSEEEICRLGRGGLVDISDPRLPEALEERKRTGRFKGEFNFVRRDGTLFPAEVTSNVFEDARGNERTVIIIRDLSEKVKTEQALRDHEHRFRTTLDNLMEGCQLLDFEWRYVYINTSAENQNRRPKEELLGKTFTDVWPGFTESDLHTALCRCMEGRIPQRMETELAFPDGCKGWYDISIEPVPEGIFILSIDITSRKMAERKNAENEELYRNLLEVAPIAIGVHSEGKVVFTNPAGLKMMGAKSYDQLIGKPIKDIVHPDYIEAAQSRIKRILSGEKGLYPVEDVYIRLDGTPINVEVMASPLTFNGKPAVQVIITDITKRKRAEERLRTSDKIFTHSVDLLCIAGFDGYFKVLNPAWTKLLGWTIEELLSRPWIDFVHPEDAHATENARTVLVGGREVFQFENRYRCKDGDLRWLSWNSFPYPEENIIFSVARDVTEKKAIEERLLERDALLEEIGKVAKIGGAIFDPIKGKTMWTEEAARMHEMSLNEEMDGRKALNFYQGEHRAKLEQAIAGVLERGEPFDLELEMTTPRGTKKWVRSISQAKLEDGNVTKVYSAFQDITHEKNIEMQLMRAQRLESVGTLASGIAHDLNNILSPILLSIDLLRRDARDETSIRLLNTIEGSATRGADIVKQVLSFTRGMDTKKTAVQSRHLVNELVLVLKETFPRSISISSNLPRDLWTIVVDHTQFHQLLLNLCVNARDAMPSGGTLTISAENKVVDERHARLNVLATPGRYVMYSVADTGVGMKPEVMDKMYDPFYTTKEIGKGTGLGLSTVYSIVKAHGGFIDVKSEVGKGTIFHIFLPASESEAAIATVTQKHASLTGNNEMILIVDDESSVREVARHTLQAFQYRVLTASNGIEALGIYSGHQAEISLVITDMMMPVMDGPKLILALKSMDPNVKIIGSSGTAEKDNYRMEELKISEFIVKPFSAEELLRIIRHVLAEGGS